MDGLDTLWSLVYRDRQKLRIKMHRVNVQVYAHEVYVEKLIYAVVRNVMINLQIAQFSAKVV